MLSNHDTKSKNESTQTVRAADQPNYRPTPIRVPRLLREAEGIHAGEARHARHLLFDPKKLVVLGDSVASRKRTGLDLPGVGRDGDVRDRRVLGLAAPVRDDVGVTGAFGHVDHLKRLGERSDLVELDQNRVADSFIDTALQADRGW